jgi:hypothetical protein
VQPQWPVGGYRIDFVVEGGGQRLALECDGDRFHPLEKLPEDMERQAILERLGWRFIRIRGSAFFRDPERTMQGVFDKLDELGIVREGTPSLTTTDEDSLVSQIIRRASELRAAWQQGVNAQSQDVGRAAPQAGEDAEWRATGDKDGRAKRTSDGSALAQPGTVPTLFPNGHERALAPGPESAADAGPPVKGQNESVKPGVGRRNKADDRVKDDIGPASIDRLLSILDEAIFPAVAGTEPRGSRRNRLERWRLALAACDATPEALYTALAECDPGIKKGQDGPKVRAAIQAWHI